MVKWIDVSKDAISHEGMRELRFRVIQFQCVISHEGMRELRLRVIQFQCVISHEGMRELG